MRQATNNSGMTLIEVLLASVILGTGLMVLLTGASRCLAVVHKAKNYQIAQWTLNMGELDYPVIDTNDVMALAVSAFEYDNGFTFERLIDDDEDEDGLYVVRTVVSWPERGRVAREEVVRYVLQVEDD
ncbi:prepilin-type N-terminal cleavage/methylation domain-containing protein [Verrucomicrobiota bacterium]